MSEEGNGLREKVEEGEGSTDQVRRQRISWDGKGRGNWGGGIVDRGVPGGGDLLGVGVTKDFMFELLGLGLSFGSFSLLFSLSFLFLFFVFFSFFHSLITPNVPRGHRSVISLLGGLTVIIFFRVAQKRGIN